MTLLARLYSSSASKVPISLIAELRRQTTVSLSKAREALSQSDGSIPGALEWLQHDLVSTGAAKAAKVSARPTTQGLIAQSLLSASTSPKGLPQSTLGGLRAAAIELNCETDFVARNALFAALAADIAHTAAFLSEPGAPAPAPAQLAEFPLIPHADAGPQQHTPGATVASAIRDTIVKVGENIALRRAHTVVQDQLVSDSVLRLVSYTHSPLHGLPCGPTSVLARLWISSPSLLEQWSNPDFAKDLGVLERSIARQLVAFDTRAVEYTPDLEHPEQALLNQPFITFQGELNGKPVKDVLSEWATTHGLSESKDSARVIDVLDFTKWTVGEPLPEQ